MDLYDTVEPDNRSPRCRHVAAAGRGEERVCNLKAAFPGYLKAWTRRADMGPRAAGKLAACGRLTADRLGDLFEGHAEHVMEKKGGPFQRRQALERHHQRQRDVVDLIVGRFDDWFRQPRPDIGLAPMPCGFQVVEAKPGHDAA